MNKRVLIIYKSVTGFTKQYAQWIAEELDCEWKDVKSVSAQTLSSYDVIIFGGRFHAGFVDGLKQAKELIQESGVRQWIVFAIFPERSAPGARRNAWDSLSKG